MVVRVKERADHEVIGGGGGGTIQSQNKTKNS